MDDTIAAIATPAGESALAVIRMSGPAAVRIAEAVFRPRNVSAPRLSAVASHTLHYGHILREGEVLDEVLVAVMRSPRTFTREDIVEIQAHGSPWLARRILDLLLARGARLADPGEFTKRAFLNGRLDLTQAEAVADLIRAKAEQSLAAAHEQLAGKLSERINRLRDCVLGILAHVEAHIDFPDEDIAPDTLESIVSQLEAAAGTIRELLASAEQGRILREGLRIAIVGSPNAGKSSLLNQLLGCERAIVAPTPGTTRDTIEESAAIRGVPVVFVDTAGLRTSVDPVEVEGIRRSREALGGADLALLVVDRSAAISQEGLALLVEAGISSIDRICVLNKADLPAVAELPDAMKENSLEVSCLTGAGIERLKDRIAEQALAGGTRPAGERATVNARHQEALRRALNGLQRAAHGLGGGCTLELAALDLRIAVSAVGEVVGKTATEDLLDVVFSRFCLGK